MISEYRNDVTMT